MEHVIVRRVAPKNDLRAWFDGVQTELKRKGLPRLSELVPRAPARNVFPGEETDDDLIDEPLTDFDFSSWPIPARLLLEHEAETRNMERIWSGDHLIAPTRLETTVDELVDELTPTARSAKADGSTRWCPSCEGEFVAGVETCPDCGVPLVDTLPQAVFAPEVETRRIDLSVWSPESRFALAHQLSGAWDLFSPPMPLVQGATGLTSRWGYALPPSMPHAWDGTTLVVPEANAEEVEAWVSAIESSVELALDPEADKLAYDVEDMNDENLTMLLESLLADGIPHELSDDGELFVHEADEAKVEAILDRIDYPDELPAQEDEELEDPDDGLEVQEILSDVFEAADRLVHDTRNPDAMLAVAEGVDRMAELGVPFGFHRDQWTALVDQASELRTAVEVDEPDREAVAEQARLLRDSIRPLV
jgi:hypothetical protein